MAIKTPNFKGQAVVETGTHWQRNEQGVYVKVVTYSGMRDALFSFASQFPLGVKWDINNSGPVSTLIVTLGFLVNVGQNESVDKWEDDVEVIDKDLGFSDLAQSLSDDGRRYLAEYRNATTYEDKTKVLQDADTSLSQPENVILGKLTFEVDRGVESIPEQTIILKRTRTMAASAIIPRTLTIARSVYSTAKLITMENIPPDVADDLPTQPYTAPAVTAWSWLPRLSNRTFVGRGLVEEQSDWVFAAWSTNLYTYVP